MTNGMKNWKQVGAVVSTIVAVLVIGHGNTRGQPAKDTRKRDAETREESAPQNKTPKAESVPWTCPMHPQVRQPKKGKCPICAMELVEGPFEPASSGGKVVQNEPALISLEQMLSIALKSNPDIRAAQAKAQAADAELDRTRLEVVQKIIAFRAKWQAQRVEVMAAEAELKEFERLRRLAKQGAVSGEKILGEPLARQKMPLLRAKLAEIEAELPFLLGSHPERRRTPNDDVKQKARVQLEVVRQVFELRLQASRHGESPDLDQTYVWSRRWMDAQQALSETKAERMAAIETHLARMKELRNITQQLYEAKEIGAQDVMAFSFYVAEAELWLAEARQE